MSKKKLFKRIALVAVTSLTAGTLSIVVAPVANAAAGDFSISTIASTTGAATVSGTIADARSVGYVAATNAAAGTIDSDKVVMNGGDAQTSVVLAGAQIPFVIEGAGASGEGVGVVVTGGTLSQIDDVSVDSAQTIAINGSRTVATVVQSGATDAKFVGLFTVSAAAGSTATISVYNGTGVDGLTTATSGTLLGSLTMTVAAANVSGTYNAGQSTIAVQAAVAKSDTAAGMNTYDTTSRIDNGKVGVILFILKDAYAAALTSGTLAVSATNSAGTSIVLSQAAGDAYAATTAFDTQAITSDANGYIYVNQPVANTAGSTTVTITFDGAVIATKTLNWAGDIASIEVSTADSNNIFLNGVTADGSGNRYASFASGIVYVVKDAAGNPVNITAAPTLTGETGALTGASLTTSTADTFATLMNTTDGYGLTSMVVPSSVLNGAGTYKIRVKNSAGQNIDSAVVNATVSGSSLNSFAVSWDKTSYAPGDIATLTVTGKDVYGNSIADGYYAVGLSFIGLSGFTSVGTACSATTKAFSGGKFTCTYAAGNDAGSFSYSYDMSTYNPQAASVGKLDIKTSAVSNAEVLAAVVKLIAEISKQIKLLQKQLKKK